MSKYYGLDTSTLGGDSEFDVGVGDLSAAVDDVGLGAAAAVVVGEVIGGADDDEDAK